MAKEGRSRKTRLGGNATVIGFGFTPANPLGNRAERRSAKKLRMAPMCSPIPGSMEMPDLPDHCLIAEANNEIVAPDHPVAYWWGCWCVLGEHCPEVADERAHYVRTVS
jgi:hypothetical protein